MRLLECTPAKYTCLELRQIRACVIVLRKVSALLSLTQQLRSIESEILFGLLLECSVRSRGRWESWTACWPIVPFLGGRSLRVASILPSWEKYAVVVYDSVISNVTRNYFRPTMLSKLVSDEIIKTLAISVEVSGKTAPDLWCDAKIPAKERREEDGLSQCSRVGTIIYVSSRFTNPGLVLSDWWYFCSRISTLPYNCAWVGKFSPMRSLRFFLKVTSNVWRAQKNLNTLAKKSQVNAMF